MHEMVKRRFLFTRLGRIWNKYVRTKEYAISDEGTKSEGD